jgi:glycosyltransferase involved in cell wall biosynthesis
MNLWIIGDAFGFPNGYGATARVLAYAQGLQANGANVRVICLKAFERPEDGVLNTEPRGVYEGIPFEYACGTRMRGATFMQRRWLELKSAWGLLRAVFVQVRREKLDAVILYTTYSLFWTLLGWFVAWLVGAKTILDVCEFPFVYRKPTWSIKLQFWILTRTVFRLVNGLIVISRYLEDFVSRCYNSARLLRVPVLVDVERLNVNGDLQNQNRFKRILYSGTLAHDGEVADLIRAFALLARDCPDTGLRIIGDSGAAVRAQIENEIHARDLAGRVELFGAIKRADLPRVLASVDVLALLRSVGTFSQAGFPTKLGEYLATGKPVVVTSTGEISDHLQGGVSAFLVPPNDVPAFAAQLRYVIEHPEHAAQVGARGRQIARERFDYRVHGKRIIEFIETI